MIREIQKPHGKGNITRAQARKAVKEVMAIATEFEEQCALCDWLDAKRILYYAIPNGGSRHKLEAKNLKRSGIKSGVPDMCIPVPKKEHGALYIELKRKKGGKVSDYQQAWITDLTIAGNKAVVCYGFDEAKRVIEEYFSGN